MAGEARHDAAVERTLLTAREAAGCGDYQDALAWLAMLEAIGHPLSAGERSMQERWRAMLKRAP